MSYALNLAADSRVLSATFPKFAPECAVVVETLPDGDITNYRYVDGEFVYDPQLVESEVGTPSQIDRIEAQVTYTAMMTDTLLEV